MDVYLSGINGIKKELLTKQLNPCDIFALESFYSVSEWETQFINKFGKFMLDSGAFTFMQSDKKIDWNKYIEKYAEFINKYDVKLFFELDIDGIIGLDNVDKLRDRLQSLTGKYPIPVWHINRGKQYFIDMCKEYPYVALGGIALKEIPLKIYEKYFPWFIKTAHQYGAKIHGLGYTNVNGLFKYHFDSVDSTAWLYGNRGGYLYRFNPFLKTMEQIKKPLNSRLKPHESAMNNFKEWVKFSQYAELNL